MGRQFGVFALALGTGIALVDSAAASFFYCPPVPELDGSSGIAAIALILSVGAVLLRKVRG